MLVRGTSFCCRAKAHRNAVPHNPNVSKADLFGSTLAELTEHLGGSGRARRVWSVVRSARDPFAPGELPERAHQQLQRICRPLPATITNRAVSRDGTCKLLLSLSQGHAIETVVIPGRGRTTVCVSTQVGCARECVFCVTASMGAVRSLSPAEIVGQVVLARREVHARDLPPLRNVVFMGMGEPLLNLPAVLAAIAVMTDPEALAISPRRITVSTAGLAGELEEFARKAPPVGLAVSLHATTDEIRGRIMPINRKYDIEELMGTLRRLPLPRRRKITFEYVLLGGENDSERDARRLGRLLRGVKAKVNVICYNPWPGSPHRPSTPEATERFMEMLMGAGYTVSLRRSRGDDILAACGQLAASRL